MQTKQKQQIEVLYKEMFEKMAAYANALLGNEALAEEAVQETFRIACQKPEQLCECENPRGWLVQTLKNTVRNIISGRESTRRLLEKCIDAYRRDNSVVAGGLEQYVFYAELAQSEEFKLLAEMVLEGKSQLEMAQSRGISLAACKKRVQRAKEALQKIIKE